MVLIIIVGGLVTYVAMLARRPFPKPHSHREELLELKEQLASLGSQVEHLRIAPSPEPSAVVIETPPVHPEPIALGKEAIGSLSEELEEVERLASVRRADPTSMAFATALADRARHLRTIVGSTSFDKTDLEHIIGCVFDPKLIATWQVGGDDGRRLRELSARLDEAVVEVVAHLREHGVEAIFPIVNRERFDSTRHADAGGSPGTTTDPAMDHVIVEVLKPGISMGGEVIFQAKVFRLQCDDVPAKVLTVDDIPDVKPTGDVGW
jgi:hypothetical protein